MENQITEPKNCHQNTELKEQYQVMNTVNYNQNTEPKNMSSKYWTQEYIMKILNPKMHYQNTESNNT